MSRPSVPIRFINPFNLPHIQDVSEMKKGVKRDAVRLHRKKLNGKADISMKKSSNAVPYIREDTLLKTVEQMSRISGIGENKLRQLIEDRQIEYVENEDRKLLVEAAIWDWYERNKNPCEKSGGVMSVSTRQVKDKSDGNGVLTGKVGIVYDVNVKYQQQGKRRTHVKKGFATKKEAVQYEAETRTKLASPSYFAH